jgi:sec-independent protein translocase protein TatA
MSNIGVPGLVIILLIVVLLFGAKKIPDIAEGIGKGLKKFKDTQKDLDKASKIEDNTKDS